MIIDSVIKKEIDAHFDKIKKILNDTSNSSNFFEQKFTYDNFVLSSCIVYNLFVCNDIKFPLDANNLNSTIENLLFNDDGFISLIFGRDNIDSINISSKKDKITAIKQGIVILKSSKIIEFKNNKFYIMNENLLFKLINSNMENCIYFMCKFFEKSLKELDFNLFSLIESCILHGNIKKNRSKIDSNFQKACSNKFISFAKSDKNIKRILHKPLAYVEILLKLDYYVVSKEKLAYNKLLVKMNIENIRNIIQECIYSNGEKYKKYDAIKKVIDDFSLKIDYKNNLTPTEKDSLIKVRVGQTQFRNDLFKIYPKCILSDIDIEELLIAGHIVPWSKCSDQDRLNPCNGLLFNACIDKLFDSHMISFDKDGFLFYSEKLKNKYPNYKDVLKSIGVKEHYLLDNNKKSIFEKIDSKHYDKFKKYLDVHLSETKNNL